MAQPLDDGPFFHGTKAALAPDDLRAWRERIAAIRHDSAEIIN